MSFKIGLPFVCLFFALTLFDGVRYPLMLVCAVLLHELGHVAAAKIMGAPFRSVQCGVQGFSLSFDYSALSYARECVILLAGSAVGLAGAGLALTLSPNLAYFALTSATMGIINLLPIRNLDGGEALLCVLNSFLDPFTAYRTAKIVSWITAVGFWLAVLWIELRVAANLSLLATALYFLWCSGEEEFRIDAEHKNKKTP